MKMLSCFITASELILDTDSLPPVPKKTLQQTRRVPTNVIQWKSQGTWRVTFSDGGKTELRVQFCGQGAHRTVFETVEPYCRFDNKCVVLKFATGDAKASNQSEYKNCTSHHVDGSGCVPKAYYHASECSIHCGSRLCIDFSLVVMEKLPYTLDQFFSAIALGQAFSVALLAWHIGLMNGWIHFLCEQLDKQGIMYFDTHSANLAMTVSLSEYLDNWRRNRSSQPEAQEAYNRLLLIDCEFVNGADGKRRDFNANIKRVIAEFLHCASCSADSQWNKVGFCLDKAKLADCFSSDESPMKCYEAFSERLKTAKTSMACCPELSTSPFSTKDAADVRRRISEHEKLRENSIDRFRDVAHQRNTAESAKHFDTAASAKGFTPNTAAAAKQEPSESSTFSMSDAEKKRKITSVNSHEGASMSSACAARSKGETGELLPNNVPNAETGEDMWLGHHSKWISKNDWHDDRQPSNDWNDWNQNIQWYVPDENYSGQSQSSYHHIDTANSSVNEGWQWQRQTYYHGGYHHNSEMTGISAAAVRDAWRTQEESKTQQFRGAGKFQEFRPGRMAFRQRCEQQKFEIVAFMSKTESDCIGGLITLMHLQIKKMFEGHAEIRRQKRVTESNEFRNKDGMPMRWWSFCVARRGRCGNNSEQCLPMFDNGWLDLSTLCDLFSCEFKLIRDESAKQNRGNFPIYEWATVFDLELEYRVSKAIALAYFSASEHFSPQKNFSPLKAEFATLWKPNGR